MNESYAMVQLDPRSLDKSREMAQGKLMLGIEVTIPEFVKLCGQGNIDPQHHGGQYSWYLHDGRRLPLQGNLAAIEVAAHIEIPDPDTTLAILRADLDAMGAAAIWNLRRKGHTFPYVGHKAPLDEVHPEDRKITARIDMVAAADKFATKGEWRASPLPTRERPWPEEVASVEGIRVLAAINDAVMDFRVPLAERVAVMEHWLLTGEEPAKYREKVERERMAMVEALEKGEILVTIDGQIAQVVSGHRAALQVGYACAPIVVALNPQFCGTGGEYQPHRKFSICSVYAGYVDFASLKNDLNAMMPGWGGPPNFLGSQQGVDCPFSIEEMTEKVKRRLLSPVT